jgi:large repetitive protein
VHINLAPPGITLTYKVSAFNDIGEGELSDHVSIILGTVPATPAAPTLIESTQTTIEIEWIAPDSGGTPITSYFVQINSGSGNTYVTVGETTALSFVVEGLTTGQTYKLKVLARNAIGSSNLSPESEEIIAAIAPDSPGQPTYLLSTKTQIAFQWT